MIETDQGVVKTDRHTHRGGVIETEQGVVQTDRHTHRGGVIETVQGVVQTDRQYLSALSIDIKQSVAGIRNVTGSNTLIQAVDVDTKVVLAVHQHPHLLSTPNTRNVTAIVVHCLRAQ